MQYIAAKSANKVTKHTTNTVVPMMLNLTRKINNSSCLKIQEKAWLVLEIWETLASWTQDSSVYRISRSWLTTFWLASTFMILTRKTLWEHKENSQKSMLKWLKIYGLEKKAHSHLLIWRRASLSFNLCFQATINMTLDSSLLIYLTGFMKTLIELSLSLTPKQKIMMGVLIML